MTDLLDNTENTSDICKIYRQLKRNSTCPKTTSKKLWELRRATIKDSPDSNKGMSLDNSDPETMLERAVAVLAENGHMPGWFNQCPTASGIGDSGRYRRSAVDLVHWNAENGCAKFIELKWESDTPIIAVQRIMRYGAIYTYCRKHPEGLDIDDRPIMDARNISLQVIAPAQFYRNDEELAETIVIAQKSLECFSETHRIDNLFMSLELFSFPECFKRIPFIDGADVKKKCNTTRLTCAGRKTRNAFNKAKPCPLTTPALGRGGA